MTRSPSSEPLTWRHADEPQWPLTRNDPKAGPDGYLHRCRVDGESWPCSSQRTLDAERRSRQEVENRLRGITEALGQVLADNERVRAALVSLGKPGTLAEGLVFAATLAYLDARAILAKSAAASPGET